MKTEINLMFDGKIEIKEGLYTVFNITLIIIYICLWRPFIIKLNREIWMTKGMLNMIPVNVVTRVKSVREFLMYNNKIHVGNMEMY